MKEIDPELNITPMDLRSAYATFMIRKYIERKPGSTLNMHNLSEEEFQSTLAAVMNTSVEQIKQVYAAASHTSYAENVALTLGICGGRGGGSATAHRSESHHNHVMTSTEHGRGGSSRVHDSAARRHSLKSIVSEDDSSDSLE